MKNRHVHSLHQGQPTQDGAGVALTRIIGQASLPRLDPFLMLDYFGSDKADEYIAGFPPHPHRGFQTVTYMLAGKMRHRDSVGNEGVINAGGIQWMNAGRGLIHEEMPEQQEGLLRGFQLWVNLPAKEKLSEPGYQDIQPEQVPTVKVNDTTRVKVLAGEFKGEKGPVATQSVKPLFLDVHLDEADTLSIPTISELNAFLYCYEGEVHIEGKRVPAGKLAVFTDGEAILVKSDGPAKAIVVAGRALNEPIAQYGPFVMNSEDEIHQALKDYRNGVLA